MDNFSVFLKQKFDSNTNICNGTNSLLHESSRAKLFLALVQTLIHGSPSYCVTSLDVLLKPHHYGTHSLVLSSRVKVEILVVPLFYQKTSESTSRLLYSPISSLQALFLNAKFLIAFLSKSPFSPMTKGDGPPLVIWNLFLVVQAYKNLRSLIPWFPKPFDHNSFPLHLNLPTT